MYDKMCERMSTNRKGSISNLYNITWICRRSERFGCSGRRRTICTPAVSLYKTNNNHINHYNAEIFLYKLWEPKGFIEFEIIINGLVLNSIRSIWTPVLWIYGYDIFVNSFNYVYTAVQRQKAVSAYFTSTQILPFAFAEQYRRHILTSKVDIALKRLINPSTAKLFNLNFHPLEVVSRWRDPQLQVSENYSDLTKWRSTVFKYCWLMSHFTFNMFKRWYLMC